MDILLVTDSPKMRRQIIQTLKMHKIFSADSWSATVAAVQANKALALLLIDVDAAFIKPATVLNTLQKDQRFNRLKTILLTTQNQIAGEMTVLEPVAVDLISRPLADNSLAARIELHEQLLNLEQSTEQIQLKQSSIFEAVFRQTPVGIAIAFGPEPIERQTNRLFRVNRAFEQISGWSEEQLIRLGWTGITHPDDLADDLKLYRELLEGKINQYTIEKRYVRDDGSIVWVEKTMVPLILKDQPHYRHVHLITDITKRKNVELALIESERSKSLLLANLPGMAYRCLLDRDWTMLFVSEGCLALTGYPASSLLYNRDLSFNDLIMPLYRELLWQEWQKDIAEGKSFHFEYELITRNGELKWVLELGEAVRDENDVVVALEGIILDITDRKTMENDLRYVSEHDLNSGLLNRQSLEKYLQQSETDPAVSSLALLVINLGNAHNLIMTFGYSYGQEFLNKCARVLDLLNDRRHLLFHTFATRFTFVVCNYRDRRELDEFCQKIIKTLQPLLEAERIVAGIGAAQIDLHQPWEVNVLFQRLLLASEAAVQKSDQPFDVVFYDAELKQAAERERAVIDVLTAICRSGDSNELYLQFQPILDLKTNKICCFEALARIDSRLLGAISPLEFIPLAEKTKLILPLGEQIILKACYFVKELLVRGYDAIRVTINVSATQLNNQDFPAVFSRILEQCQVDPDTLCLEITESAFDPHHIRMGQDLERLKEKGVKIAIDDFGTGYSSFARERELPVDWLKIDRYFIQKLMEIEPDKALTGDIVAMAHRLGHLVVAEGVEYDEQYRYLLANDCDKLQGFWLSRPLDAAKAIDFLAQW